MQQLFRSVILIDEDSRKKLRLSTSGQIQYVPQKCCRPVWSHQIKLSLHHENFRGISKHIAWPRTPPSYGSAWLMFSNCFLKKTEKPIFSSTTSLKFQKCYNLIELEFFTRLHFSGLYSNSAFPFDTLKQGCIHPLAFAATFSISHRWFCSCKTMVDSIHTTLF